MFTDWFLAQEGQFLYLMICLTLIGGAFFLPFPEDLILIIIGILVQRKLVELEWAFPLAYSSIIVGDMILYGIGRRFGINLFSKRWFRNRIPPAKIKAVRARLDKNFIAAIFLGRHLFYLRTITFICCGAVKMKFLRYLLADMMAALISSTIMITIGYYASENYESIRGYIQKTEIILAIALVLGGLYWYYRHRKNQKVLVNTSESDLN